MAVRWHSALTALKGTISPVVHGELSKLKWARQARPHAPAHHDRPKLGFAGRRILTCPPSYSSTFAPEKLQTVLPPRDRSEGEYCIQPAEGK